MSGRGVRPRCCPSTTRPAIADLARGLARPGLGAGVERRHGPGARRCGPPRHRRRRPHRLPGDPRPPGRHTAPACTAASSPTSTSPTTAPSCGARHRAHRPRGVNLYPFTREPGIEMIDIGGPAMVRAAAKNHAHVGIVVDPADYEPVLDELRAGGRAVGATRRGLARRPRSPTPRPTTPPSWPGWRRRRPRRRAGGRCPPRSPAPRAGRRSCATARTPTSRPRATASRGVAGGTAPCSTAARSCRISTCSTPRPRGDSCTLRRAGRGDHQARQPVRRRRGRRHRRRLPAPTSATRSRRSAASSPLNRPVPTALAEALAPVFTEVVVAPGVRRRGARS